MLATHKLMEAAAAARQSGIRAVLERDARVRFARLAGVKPDAGGLAPRRPCLLVYVDPAADVEAAGTEVAAALETQAGTAGLDVAVMNGLDLEAAGRLMRASELLLDRDPEARAEFEVRAFMAYTDFCESERLVLRERAERPYGEILAVKLGQLDEQIRRLKELAALDVEGYVADWKAAYVTERALEVTIGLCIAIMGHALKQRGLGPAATYRGHFAIARDAGLLDGDLAAAFMRMCGFRNVLAHEGLRLDPAAVIAALTQGAADIARFRDAAARF